MTADPNTGSIISQEEAIVLASAFDRKFPNQITSSFIGSNNLKALLDQTDCIGVRVYNGYDDALEKISLIFVGVDSADRDILENGLIYDKIATCPPMCSTDSLLAQ
jgi:hypothetical protein